jgi:ferrous iron transport protein B
LSKVLSPLLIGLFDLLSETVWPLIAAFLRKDLAVDQFSAIEMSKY